MKTSSISIAIVAILALVGQSCDKTYTRIEGMGTVTTQTLDINTFTGIRLEGADDVDINYGPEQSVEVTGHPNIISRIKTRVYDGVWEMGLENGNYGNYELRYTLTLPTLDDVEIIGSADVNIQESLHTGPFDLFIMGSGNFNGFLLSAENSYVEIIGSGNCEITTSSLLDVVIEGSGSVYYKGHPSIQTDITGSGRILDAN